MKRADHDAELNFKIDAQVLGCIRLGTARKAGSIEESCRSLGLLDGMHSVAAMRAIDRSLQRLRKRKLIQFKDGLWQRIAVKP